MQRLQFFLSESTWDQEAANARRLQLLLTDPVTAPHPGGVLVVDDSGGRKDGYATAHVGVQYLGWVGKTRSGVLWPTRGFPRWPRMPGSRGQNPVVSLTCQVV
ncbi:transposase [Streptomyces sp. NPDC017529]|uniref:transposase n=1 Tax=Streptomyces sp. NPDC017529 TaxID=3365000 RepID=UPI0037A232BD